MSVVPRLHAVHDDGDRTVYLCGVQDCDSETNHGGTTLVGWIERGRELATQHGTKVEFAFVPNHPTHPRGSVHLGNIAQAWQDARNFAGLVADHQLVVSSSADRPAPSGAVGATSGSTTHAPRLAGSPGRKHRT